MAHQTSDHPAYNWSSCQFNDFCRWPLRGFQFRVRVPDTQAATPSCKSLIFPLHRLSYSIRNLAILLLLILHILPRSVIYYLYLDDALANVPILRESPSIGTIRTLPDSSNSFE